MIVFATHETGGYRIKDYDLDLEDFTIVARYLKNQLS